MHDAGMALYRDHGFPRLMTVVMNRYHSEGEPKVVGSLPGGVATPV
jgi:hypothetical protein